MDNLGLVSVIVPIYNVEKVLNRCIDSLLNQTYPYLEIILVDDGSLDQCGSICDAYAQQDPRIRVIHKANAGLGMARNSGLEIATGEYILFVDSDDYVTQCHVECLLNGIKEENADMAVAGYVRDFSDGKTISVSAAKSKSVLEKDQIMAGIFLPVLGSAPDAPGDVDRTMSVWANIYRRSLIAEQNLCFVSEREYVSEDLFFNIHYIQNAKKIVLLPVCNYLYSENLTSLTNTLRPDRFEKYCKMLQYETAILKSYGIFEIAKLRVFRTFIMKTKKCIAMIACSDIAVHKKVREVKKILKHELLEDVIDEYVGNVTDKRQWLQLFLLRKKLAIPLILFYRLKSR